MLKNKKSRAVVEDSENIVTPNKNRKKSVADTPIDEFDDFSTPSKLLNEIVEPQTKKLNPEYPVLLKNKYTSEHLRIEKFEKSYTDKYLSRKIPLIIPISKRPIDIRYLRNEEMSGWMKDYLYDSGYKLYQKSEMKQPGKERVAEQKEQAKANEKEKNERKQNKSKTSVKANLDLDQEVQTKSSYTRKYQENKTESLSIEQRREMCSKQQPNRGAMLPAMKSIDFALRDEIFGCAEFVEPEENWKRGITDDAYLCVFPPACVFWRVWLRLTRYRHITDLSS